MGYVYSVIGGRQYLDCDVCCRCVMDEGVGPVRKVPCPVGYCPPTALCAKCKAELTTSGRWAEAHTGCREVVERERNKNQPTMNLEGVS